MRVRLILRTTHRVALQQAAPDLIGSNFASEEPDRLWVDLTYRSFQREGFVYLAFILDACSRRLVDGDSPKNRACGR